MVKSSAFVSIYGVRVVSFALKVTAAMANICACMLCNIILLVSFLAFEDLLLILRLGMHLAYHRQTVEADCDSDATLTIVITHADCSAM